MIFDLSSFGIGAGLMLIWCIILYKIKQSLEEKMKYEIIMLVITFFIVVAVFILGLKKMELTNTYIQCCNSTPCSDTYYTEEDNLCHLTLCENSPFTDKSKCTYKGANISYNLTSRGKYED